MLEVIILPLGISLGWDCWGSDPHRLSSFSQPGPCRDLGKVPGVSPGPGWH